MLIFINEQRFNFGWLSILDIQIRFWASFVRVERCSVIPLYTLCYTLFWSRHQIVDTLVHLGCKGKGWSSCFHMFIVMILCFFTNIMQDMRY